MPRLVFPFFLLMFCFVCVGQQGYLSDKTIKLGKDFSFPSFTGQGINVRKINRLLQLTELELLRGFESSNIFERVSLDDGTIYGGKTSIEYAIKKNTDKVLSIRFNEASCGATCHYWVRYYNFNPGNGDLIHLKDLFTEKGYELFHRYANAKRIRELKHEHGYDSSFADIPECYEEDDMEDFYVSGNVLCIDGENCFSKNQKFSGIKTVSVFQPAEYRRYLNRYGQVFFGIADDTIGRYRSKSSWQLFSGKIGREEVLMVMKYEKEVKAEYVYSRYGHGIFLSGKMNEGQLDLMEYINGKDSYRARLKAYFDGWNIKGIYYTLADTAKTHPVLLKRQ